MLSLWQNILFFLPLFLVINVVAAVPGRLDLQEAFRTGVRHFLFGTLILVVISALLYWLLGWLIETTPLW